MRKRYDPSEEKDNKHCPKCGRYLTEKFSKSEHYHPFRCSCGQELCFTRHKFGRRRLYIDDFEHMGLMTSGPGGY